MFNIMFMGTPDFASVSLELLSETFNVSCVVCQPDKPKGRGGKMSMPPVKEEAIKKGISVYQPETLKDGAFAEVLEKEKPDIIAVVAYGKLLPKYVLDYPKYGCINLHGSILPKYRGSAPIQWSVINGDKTAGVTTMFMSEGLDSGDILEVYETPIGETETAGELFDRLAVEGAKLLKHTIENIENITPVPQDESLATKAPMLNKEMGKITFAKSAKELYNLIRGLNPWPVAYINTNKGTLKVYESRVLDEKPSESFGMRTGKGLEFQTPCGRIEFTSVQLQGKKRMSAEEFLRGNGNIVFEED